MIRITNLHEIQAIDELEVFIDSMEVINQEILQETRDEIAPEALNELSTEPGKVKYPIEWTSERQRRAFFATDGFGSGIPYQRTGKLAEMWVIEVRGNALVIENKSAIAKYVYGSLAQNRNAALRFQQGFHANTGWQAATDTTAFWLDAAQEVYIDKFDETLKDFATGKLKRRAFTKGTRRR